MTRRRQENDEPIPPPGLAPRGYRPSPRFALQISLGVHALIVLVLFRMVSEYAAEPELPLHIVTRGSAPRTESTPSFVAIPLATVDAPKVTSRPAARADSLPRQATTFLQSIVTPIRAATPGTHRAAPPAKLPVTNVALPDEVVLPLAVDEVALRVDDAEISLARTDTWRDLPLRIASRPIYGPRAQRPLGLAALPASRDGVENAAAGCRLRPSPCGRADPHREPFRDRPRSRIPRPHPA